MQWLAIYGIIYCGIILYSGVITSDDSRDIKIGATLMTMPMLLLSALVLFS